MDHKVIAITGAAGFFAHCLIPLLEADPAVERIIGIDRVYPPEAEDWKKFEFHQFDVRDPELGNVLPGVDVLIHLAFVLMRLPGAKDVDDINIDGSRNVFSQAAAAGIPKVIFTSSVVAYGIREDNPVPLTEDLPLRPNEDLYYSHNKASVEKILREISQGHPAMITTVLRPCTVVGPHADPASMDSLTGATITLVRGYDPLYQLVHEDDVAQAIHLAVTKDMPGTFNVSADEPTSLSKLAELAGKNTMQLPLGFVKPMFHALWRMKMTVFAPEWVKLTQYPIVAANDRLKAAGWNPRFTTPQAFLDLQEAFRVE